MIREFVASNASKLLAACVCPVAGAGLVALNVPDARNAMHNLTAPRAGMASPNFRRPINPANLVPCARVDPVLLGPQIAQAQAIPNTVFDLPDFERGFAGPRLIPSPIPRIPDVSRPPNGGPNPPPAPPGGQTPTENPTIPVPEPGTWLQIIFGFGLIGSAVRLAYRGDWKPRARA